MSSSRSSYFGRDDGCSKLQAPDLACPDTSLSWQRFREAGLDTWLAEQTADLKAGLSHFSAGQEGAQHNGSGDGHVVAGGARTLDQVPRSG